MLQSMRSQSCMWFRDWTITTIITTSAFLRPLSSQERIWVGEEMSLRIFVLNSWVSSHFLSLKLSYACLSHEHYFSPLTTFFHQHCNMLLFVIWPFFPLRITHMNITTKILSEKKENSDTNRMQWHASIYLKFKNKQNKSILLKVGIGLPLQRREGEQVGGSIAGAF